MDTIRHLFGYGFSQTEVPSLIGKTFFVTGGSNGIGLSVARTLYSHGARVVIVGAHQDHLDGAVSYIETGDHKYAPETYAIGFGSQKDKSADGGEQSGELKAHLCDFKDLRSVAELGKKIADTESRLDGALLIAGLGVNAFELTKDGYDSHLIVNSVSQVLLLSHLLPILEKTSKLPETDVRVVSMSSELHRATFANITFGSEDEFKRDLGPLRLYSRTKLADILLIKRVVQLYLEPSQSSIRAYTTHPGAVSTDQPRQYREAYGETVGGAIETVVRPIMRAPDDGALSILWASTSPEARDKYPSGTYFSNPDQDGQETNEAKDQQLIENFWNESIKIIEKVAPNGLGPFKA